MATKALDYLAICPQGHKTVKLNGHLIASPQNCLAI
jgi:hypothetical protein